MLQELHVKNFALIDDVEVEFHEGLNILSGETGAGKSIIMGSIGMALGQKTSKDYIRHGASYAYVELAFHVEEDVYGELLKLEIEPEDGIVMISRKISDTKSTCRINGEAVSLQTLREVATLLIDIHGQQDNQILTKPAKQLAILDSYAKNQISDPLCRYRELYQKYNAVVAELSKEDMDENARLREAGYLEFVIQEIDDAKLSLEEEEELAATFKRMNHLKSLNEGLDEIEALLYEDHNGSASDRIGNSIKTVMHLLTQVGADEALGNIQSMLYDIESMLNDLEHELSVYSDELGSMDGSYDQVKERMDQIHDLKAKYGRTIEDVLRYRNAQEERLMELKNYEEKRKENEQLRQDYYKELMQLSEELHEIRSNTARELSVSIAEALSDLNFLNSQFEIQVAMQSVGTFGPNGRDVVTFMISPNVGEPLKPVAEIASGGELSRIMLALKAVVAGTDGVGTMIFDEIDAGISGRTAQKVAEKLLAISKEHQIICISHLPQIVAMADYHYLIEKFAKDNVTKTEILQLEYEESVNEIARLLGGTEITQNVMDSAWEMKELAQKNKY